MNQPFASFISVFHFTLLRTAVTDFNIQLGQAYFKAQTHQSTSMLFQNCFHLLPCGESHLFVIILQLAGGGRSSLMLLPAANEFLLYFRSSDWLVAQISWQRLNRFPPSHFLELKLARLASTPEIRIRR